MLTLDDEHRYHLDGRRVPGVHDCLNAACLIDDRWYTEEARYKGNYVDAGCYLIGQNKLDWSQVRPSFRGHLEGFKRFLDDTGFYIKKAKHRAFSPLYRFAGELDLYGVFPNRTLDDVLDIKASAGSEKWWRYQTAAYAQLMKEETGVRPGRLILRLSGDGKYMLDPRHEDRDDLKVFLAALTICNAKGG